MGRRARIRALIRDYVESLAIAVMLALCIRFFVLTAYKIPTASMWPTLQVGDFVFAYKLPYGLQLPFMNEKFFSYSTPERGEVIVFRYPGDESISYIKRVVAIPGDRIEIQRKKLYVNGEMAKYEEAENSLGLSDAFIVLKEDLFGSQRLVTLSRTEDKATFGPQVVPPGHVFVMGDNRDSSDDSRYWGMIPVSNVDGKILTVWLSLDWQKSPGGLPQIRWQRFMASVR